MTDTNRYVDQINKFIPAFDGVRGWSILMVLFVHTYSLYPIASTASSFEKHLNELSGYGRLGVDFFFVLSGFLITGILLNSKKEDKYFINFYVRRTLRIFPLYYISISLIFIITPYVVDSFTSQLFENQYIIYYLYLQNFFPMNNGLPKDLLNPLWSLAIEEHFYFIWPFIIFYSKRNNAVIVSILLIIVALVTRHLIIFYQITTESLAFTATYCRMDSILIGAILAMLVRTQFSNTLNKYKCHMLLTFTCISIVIVVLDQVFKDIKYCYASYTVGFTIYALLFASIINYLLFLDTNHKLMNLFENKVIMLFGKHSYAIYIFHMSINCMIWNYIIKPINSVKYLPMATLFFIISAIISLIFSIIVWHTIEKHFIAMKRYFTFDVNRTISPRCAENEAKPL